MHRSWQQRRPTSETQPSQHIEEPPSHFPVPEPPTQLDATTEQGPVERPEVQRAQPQYTVLPPGSPPPPTDGPVTIQAPLADFRYSHALPMQNTDVLADQIRAELGKGMPLGPQVQRQLETGLGEALSGVRVHTDATADALARSVQAVAFTTGRDIFFQQGAYHPETPQGLQILAHEATHTVQQSRGPVDGTPHPGGVSISDPGDRFERAASEAVAGITDGVAMQRAARPERELAVQRMPTSAQVTAEVGGPKANRKKYGLFGDEVEMGTHYKAVLAALDTYQTVVGRQIAPVDLVFKKQIQDIQKALRDIDNACNDYLATGRDNEIAVRCRSLQREGELEAVTLGALVTYFANNPTARQGTWKDALPQGMATRVVDIEAEGGVAGVKAAGALNEVTKVTLESGYSGFFKGDKPWAGFIPGRKQRTKNELFVEWDKYLTKIDALKTQLKSATGDKQKRKLERELATLEAEMKAVEGAHTEVETSEIYGINTGAPGFAKRNVAAYRIDQLFGAGVIPKTELAMMGSKQGSLMAAAKGETLGKVASEQRLFYDIGAKRTALMSGAPQGQVSVHADNPGLQMWLSRLSLIDAIIGQLDRHWGNMFITTDTFGNVTGVTGIDNDLAFPTTNFVVTQNTKEYKGLPDYADKELAERILATSDNDVKAVVSDLLSSQEIAALVQRFDDVKQHLQNLKAQGDLLDPNQWTALTGTAQEGTGGYLGSVKMATKT